jgi:hypothetical protein
MERKFWASVTRKPKTLLGPYETREAAIAQIFTAYPSAKEATSGYGSDGIYFDIQWERNPQR